MAQVSISTEPIELETPVMKHKVVLRPYAPARLKIEVRKLFLKHGHINMKEVSKSRSREEVEKMDVDKIANFDEVTADITEEVNLMTVRHMVVSVDGNTENIEDTILNMHQADYQAIVLKCNEIDKATSVDDKKKLESPQSTPGA